MPDSTRAKPAIRTLGPIADLEAHLPTEWWRELFDALYLKTDGDVVENADNTRVEVDMLIRGTGVEPGERLLDLCCGQGRHSLELATRGFLHVTGVDRSRYLIRLARRRARTQNLKVAFREGDARSPRLAADSMDCVFMMGNSFGYFDRAEDDHQVVSGIKRMLRGSGRIALDITDGAWIRDSFEPRSWEWIDQNHFVCRERSLSQDGQRLITREVITHAERGVIADQFYAERLYARQQLADLLDNCGFQDIVFHGTLKGQSTRNQDLGMMANRMFVTARAPAKPARLPRDMRAMKVTVLLGDPSLPDSVKRDGQFNPEDLDTVRQLKQALGSLTEYQFSYLDRHETLGADLRRGQRSLVFNLCDEGYGNDAFKELHVPALLEMMGIEYTGGGPACLGMCYDKAIVRSVASAHDIPVPLETFVFETGQSATLPSVFPAILKPAWGDSSIGITKDAVVHDAEQLVAYLMHLFETLPGRPVLVQEFLTGPEYSVALIGNPGFELEALPILAVDYGKLDPSLPPILGYESKWQPDSPYWTDIAYLEADLDDFTRRQLISYSETLFGRLQCRDYARFDFRADTNGTIKLLEVNPNPGWCWDGKLNLMAGMAGWRYADLLAAILKAARFRLSGGDLMTGQANPDDDRLSGVLVSAP